MFEIVAERGEEKREALGARQTRQDPALHRQAVYCLPSEQARGQLNGVGGGRKVGRRIEVMVQRRGWCWAERLFCSVEDGPPRS